MAELKPSDIVQSLAGHDRGSLFYVLRVEDGGVLVADGRLRKCLKPKRKNAKHLAFVSEGKTPVAARIRRGESVADSEVRKSLPAEGGIRTAKGGN